MLASLARWITRKPKRVVILALLLMIPSLIGYASTRINFDILTYIPKDLDSARGEALLEDPFHMAATAMLIVEDMPPDYTAQLQEEIETVPGVSQVLSAAGSLGSQLPPSMLPEELRGLFYAKDPTKNSTQMMIFFSSPAAAGETLEAVDTIRDIANERCFLAGFSALIHDSRVLIDEEMPIYISAAAILAVLAMILTMSSWVLPVAIILNIGLAITYNMGSNAIFGEISFVTEAMAAILQLGVTLDYSVFLYNRYEEEIPRFEDRRDAMAAAIQGSFSSLAGSSLTTICGFAALCFMQLTLGLDVGLVMMKGVFLGILSVVFILPCILLVLDKPLHKYTHRSLKPDFTRMNRFLVRHRKAFLAVALVAYLPAIYSQVNTEVYHDLIGNMLPPDTPSMAATQKLQEDYGVVNQHFLLVHQDAFTGSDTIRLVDELEAVPGVDSVLTFRSWVPRSVPDFFIPDDVMNLFQQDGWTYLMVDSSCPTGSPEMSQQIEQLETIMKSYDPGGYLTGAAAMSNDLFTVAEQDFTRTNLISIGAIFLIVMLLFRSVSMPVILVGCIELAIYINEGIPYWTGTQIPFIANIFIGCIQLGATVDYSILLGTRFREELQKGLEPKEAMVQAASLSDHSILTGGMVLFASCISVTLFSRMSLVTAMCTMLARGTLISMIICLFFVPPILLICEPIVRRTTLGWRSPWTPSRLPKLRPSSPSDSVPSDSDDGESH